MKAKLIAYLVILMITFTEGCSAQDSLVELQKFNSISGAMEIYRELYGQLPTSWEQIASVLKIDVINNALMQVYGYRLQDRYQFVSKPYPIFENGDDFDIDEKSRVLLVRVIPFNDYPGDDRAFRNFVYQSGKGYISSIRLPEERAQKLFKTYGITVVVPPGLPKLETVVNRLHQPLPALPLDPTDAKRVWPPGPKQSQASQASAFGTANTAVAHGSEAPSSRLYLWSGIAAAALCSAVWLLFCFRKKDGSSRR